MNSFTGRRLLAALAAGLLATACDKVDLGKFGKAETAPPAAQSTEKPVRDASPATPMATVMLPDFATLAEKEGPAVVNVSVTQTLARGGPQFPGVDEDDPFFDFFRRFIPQQPRRGDAPIQQGVGSGFIISDDGYILTNRHVVDNADVVTVRLTDKREFKAKVIGSDSRTDVALIKIDGKNLPKVPVGNASKIRVGEWVVAIGSPFGFENSVTAGIVSAINRALPDENFVPFIQTDVAINPGNSGGPLFNMKGEVIGINSQIYSRTGGFMGLSFAIPIDVAMDVADQLKTTGRVARGRIGVQIQNLNAELANSFGLPDAKGALVVSVERGSPADKAGLQAGDVIREFDGKTVGGSNELPRIVGLTKPGATVKMKVWRKGEAKDLSITVADTPAERTAAKAGDRPSKSAEKMGLTLTETEDGLVVQEVRGPAAAAGLRPGDVIISVNNQRTETVDDFRERIAQAPRGRSVALLVQRGENTLFVPVKPG
jgi:serine protease Do